MCFSAPASFIASAGLMAIGSIAVAKSKTTPQRIFAAIPIIFSIQQFSEGLLWLSFFQPAYTSWHNPAMYIFIFFAQVLWPVYVPLSILLLEKNPVRRKILLALLSAGILVSAYVFYCLVFYKVTATIGDHHIYYDLNFPFAFRWSSGLLYILAAGCSPFVSGYKQVRLLGVILMGSYLFARLFYMDYIVSVWCYFAAILSIMILFIILNLRKQQVSL